MDVTEKTVRRDIDVLRSRNAPVDPETIESMAIEIAPNSANLRRQDVIIIPKAISAYDMAMAQAKEAQSDVSELRKELGFTGERCNCCGRLAMRGNAQAWSALAALHTAINKQLELLAKLNGQLDPAAAMQRMADFDLMVSIEAIGKVAPEVAADIYRVLAEVDPRRARRLPTLPEMVRGEFDHTDPDEEAIEGEFSY